MILWLGPVIKINTYLEQLFLNTFEQRNLPGGIAAKSILSLNLAIYLWLFNIILKQKKPQMDEALSFKV